MRITLVISSLKGGGAERSVSLMANYWAGRGACVTILTMATADTDVYALDSSIARVAINLQGASTNVLSAATANIKRLLALRGAIRRSHPDVIVSFMESINVLTLLASAGLRAPIIVMEQVDPREHPMGWMWEALRRMIYPRASALVLLTDRLREWAQTIVPTQRVHVIPNPVRPLSELQAAGASGEVPACMATNRRKAIAMGRLAHQKGFDILLRAFAACAAENPNWDLIILGEGEERNKLEELIRDLGISDRAYMPGRLAEPAAALQAADLFVMSSRFEGLPLALLEAMACGLPAISADCPTGPREVIREGIDGVLVETENGEALATAMRRLMSDDLQRKALAERTPEVQDRFGLEKVMAQWDDVVAQAVQSRRLRHSRSRRNAEALSSGNGSLAQTQRPARVRIAFLIHQLEAGGAERQLTTLLKGLDRSLFDILLITFKPGGRFSDEVAHAGIRMVSLGKQRHWDLAAPFVRFVRLARKERLQIIHGYMPTSNVFAGLLKLFVKRTRIVWGIRAAQEDFGSSDKLSALAFRAQCRLSPLADLVIANSEAGKRVCLRNGFPPERVVVIPNGVDIDRFQPDALGRARLRAEWGIGENQFAIGLVGRLHPVKDHITFLRAAALLLQERRDIRFVCVGDGGEDYTRELRQLAVDYGISKQVVWAGMCSDMPPVYSALDINTCCSLSEGFPNGVAEAMACGVPCVATDVGDCKLLVGKTGKIVPPEFPGALAKAWKECLSADCKILGEQARMRIEGEFAMTRLVERTERVLWPKG